MRWVTQKPPQMLIVAISTETPARAVNRCTADLQQRADYDDAADGVGDIINGAAPA
jgi:hypothetical protein